MRTRSASCTRAWTCARTSERRYRGIDRLVEACRFSYLSLVPFLRLFVLGFQDRLGANPIEFITHSTGFWTLTFLCITLTVTPLRRLTGWQQLVRLRRMLGLFAFFYASAHLVTYVWFDQWFSLEEIVKDVWKRPFITVGFTAFLLLVPLAVTSTNFMMRRLGRRWSQLHRLVYLIVHPRCRALLVAEGGQERPVGAVALLGHRLRATAVQAAVPDVAESEPLTQADAGHRGRETVNFRPAQRLSRRSASSRSATVSRARTG